MLGSYTCTLTVILAGYSLHSVPVLRDTIDSGYLVQLAIAPKVAEDITDTKDVKEAESQDYLTSAQWFEEDIPHKQGDFTTDVQDSNKKSSRNYDKSLEKNKTRKATKLEFDKGQLIFSDLSKNDGNITMADKDLSLQEIMKTLLLQSHVETAVPSNQTCMAALMDKMAQNNSKDKPTESKALQLLVKLIQKTCKNSTFCSATIENAQSCPEKVKIEKRYFAEDEFVKADCIIQCIIE